MTYEITFARGEGSVLDFLRGFGLVLDFSCLIVISCLMLRSERLDIFVSPQIQKMKKKTFPEVNHYFNKFATFLCGKREVYTPFIGKKNWRGRGVCEGIKLGTQRVVS